MNIGLVLFSTACLSFLAMPAAGTSLFAASAGVHGDIFGSDITGAALISSGGEPLVIQQHGSIAVGAVPGHHVVVQHPAEHKPVQQISLVPVATFSSNSISNKLANLWGGIASAINIKTSAVGNFLRSLHGPPKVILINVDTTTTTKPPKTTTTKHHPVIVEVVAPHRRVYPIRMPYIDDCVKK